MSTLQALAPIREPEPALLWPDIAADPSGREKNGHVTVASTVVAFRKKLLERFNAEQMELDFTPRRRRWEILDQDKEDTGLWPEWMLIKLHHRLLDDLQVYLWMAWTRPDFVKLENTVDRLMWVRSEREDAFSFRACCRLSGIDPDRLQNDILRKFRQRGIPA